MTNVFRSKIRLQGQYRGHCRSLGYARDAKMEGSDFYLEPSDWMGREETLT